MNIRLISFVWFILATGMGCAYAIDPLTIFMVSSAIVGAGTQLGLGIYGMQKGESEAKRVERLNLGLRSEEMEESKRQFNENLSQRKKEFGLQERESKVNRANNFLWNLSGHLMANKQSAQNFSKILRERR